MTDGAAAPRIVVRRNGPYRVTGADLLRMRPVADANGDRVDWERGPAVEHQAEYDLCRCGASTDMPFCDGSEERIDFDGTETASHAPYADRAFRVGDGGVILTDDPSLCSKAAFCQAADTDAWDLAERGADPAARERLATMVRRCPSGRLALLLPPATIPIEEDIAPQVGVVKDGPYWVRGGIAVEAADGSRYEIRARVTLCRCGASRNKPFCDGSHARVRFKDPA